MRRLAYWIAVAVSITVAIMTYHKLGWVQFFGWVYSLAFALSALPQTLKSIKDGHTKGVADGTLILWSTGEIGGILYGLGIGELPIIFNCAMNTIFVGIIVRYRLFPRKEDQMT
jgi:uncharacterized protein with PQ loop repeat